MTTPWYPILGIVTIVLAVSGSYLSSRISLAEELGDRPTREEMNGHITELKETIIREVKDAKEEQRSDYEDIKEQLRETGQDIRELRQVILDNRS